MRRARPEEVREMRAELEQWHTPSSFKSALNRMREPHGFYTAGQGVLQPWREAFCAWELALLHISCG
jgi:hypothetical protein